MILLPGLGADHRLFEEQKAVPGVRIESLPRPQEGESFRAYAVRVWKGLAPVEPIWAGGFSFGGMLALEAARDPACRPMFKGIVLISSCRSRRAITDGFRRQQALTRWIPAPLAAVGAKSFLSGNFVRKNGISGRHADLVRAMAAELDIVALRYGARAYAEWDFEGPEKEFPELPVRQIHGARDSVIPPVPGDADTVLPDAGHLLQYTHAEELNRWLTGVLSASTT